MKNWIKTHKKQIIQLLIAIGVGVVISGIFLLIFYLTGVFYWDNGFKFNIDLFNALRDNPWLYVVYMLVEAAGCVLLCMNPVGSGVFVWLGMALFGANWKCFLATFGGCFLSYIIIDAIGRFGGSRIVKKIFGEEEYKKISDLISNKNPLYILFIYLGPIFPDDFTCLVAGSMKINWWLHMLFALIGKSVGIATVVFGINIIPKELFLPITADKLYNWFILVACLIVYIVVILKLFKWANKKVAKLLEKKRGGNQNEEN